MICRSIELELDQLSRRLQGCSIDHSIGTVDDLVDVCSGRLIFYGQMN